MKSESRIQRVLVLSLLTLLLASPALMAQPSYEIRLLDRSWTPEPGPSDALRSKLAEMATKAAPPSGKMHLLVQLHEVPENAMRQDLWRRGLDLGAYVPGNAWVSGVPAAAANGIAQWPEVRSVDVWTASLKLHPRVRAGEWGPWTRDPERPGMVMALVQLHHDVDLVGLADLVKTVGGVAMDPLKGFHGATAWLPEERVEELADNDDVLWIEEGPMPLSANNDGARDNMNADEVIAAPYNLDGSGVRLFVFDAGTVRATHETFDAGGGSRVTVIDGQASSDHPTHVAGTAAGDGSGSAGGRGRGVATGASLLSAGYSQTQGTMLFWDNAGDIQADYSTARNTHDADLGTNSIGSNTASNGYPCSREGDYGVTSNLLDGIVAGDNGSVTDPMILTWANGNERTGGTPRGRCGSNYVTTAPPSCAKNPIQVGALNSDGGSMTSFSSWGPCDDGRMKPVVSGPGCESGRVSGEAFIYSSLNSSNSAYGGSGWCGTSMSTPAVAGVVSLLIEDWRAQGHGGAFARPLPALVKAMLIQTARDQGADGPDFIYGYGAVDAEDLIDLLRAGNGTLGTGTDNWGTGSVSNGANNTFNISVPSGTGELKVSLAWDDVAAAAFAGTALVNDLDLELVAPDTTVHRPWVLNAGSPHAAATTGVNTLDNQEQAVVANPQAGTWTVRVVGSNVPSGPQDYGVAYEATPELHDGTGCTTTSWGWEASNEGWSLTGTAARIAAPAGGHGSTSLRFGNANNTDGEATLDFAVPSDAVEATLTYWWHMTTDEGASGHGWDNFIAELRNTSGTVLSVHDVRNDGWAEGQWMQEQNVDLSGFAGQTVRLTFRGTNDVTLPTRFFIDDAAVTSCNAGGGGNTAPTVTITSPADGSSFTEGNSVSFAGTANDTEDGDISANLSWSSSIDGNIGSGASFSTSSLSAGTHTITASVTDSGGLQGSDNISVTINAANTAPTVTITSPADGSSFTVGNSVSFAGTANDTEDGDISANLSWSSSIDGNIGSGASFSTSSLSLGTHTITASVTDSGGLQGSDNISVTINAVANTAPTVTITSPADGSSFNSGDSVSFAGTANDTEDGDISANLSWSSSIDGNIGSGASFSTSSLSVGTHTITASVTDSGGLQGSDDISVTINSVGVPTTVVFTSIANEDGWVRESNETSNVGGNANSGGAGRRPIRAGDATQDRQYKAILSFDTSSIPAGATITAVTLRLTRGRLTGSNPFATFGSGLADVQTGGFNGNTALEAADFQALATAVGVATLTDAPSDGSVSEGVFNAAGLAAINENGTTQVRIYFTLDDNDDGGNDYMGYYSGDHNNSSNHPELEVTYIP